MSACSSVSIGNDCLEDCDKIGLTFVGDVDLIAESKNHSSYCFGYMCDDVRNKTIEELRVLAPKVNSDIDLGNYYISCMITKRNLLRQEYNTSRTEYFNVIATVRDMNKRMKDIVDVREKEEFGLKIFELKKVGEDLENLTMNTDEEIEVYSTRISASNFTNERLHEYGSSILKRLNTNV